MERSIGGLSTLAGMVVVLMGVLFFVDGLYDGTATILISQCNPISHVCITVPVPTSRSFSGYE